MNEPRLLSLQEVLQLGNQEAVPSLSARVKAVSKHWTSPPGAAKPWKKQVITLTDGVRDIDLVVWGRDPLPQSWIGHTLKASSSMGPRGLAGLKMHFDDYKGANKMVVSVYESATLQDMSGATPSPSAPPQQPQAQRTPELTGHAPQDPGSLVDVVMETKRLEFLYRMCFDRAIAVQAEIVTQYGQEKFSDADLRACAATLFMAAERRGLHQQLPVS